MALSMSRPAPAAAAFSFERGRVAKKRGPKKKTGVSRHACGKIRSDTGTDYSLMQRMARRDRAGLPQLLSILGHSAQANPVAGTCEFVGRDAERVCDHARMSGSQYCCRHHREAQDIVLATTAPARNPNLSVPFPIGAAFERGLLALGPHDGNTDGRELFRAADIYARLHRRVWGKLNKDIEAALGPDDTALLREVGPVHSPHPPHSNFRKLVGETPIPAGEADPETYLRDRLRDADRYAASRTTLQNEGLHCLLMVEHVVIDGITPTFLQAGVTLTARGAEDRRCLVHGLLALAKSYGLFDRRPAAAAN